MPPRSKSEKTVSRKISDFVARTTLKNIPPDVRDIAKLHLLDGLATMLGGAKEESSRLLCRHYARLQSKAEAAVIGTRHRLATENAALVNGVEAHVLDYDDAQLTTLGSRPLGQQTHPTSPVLAAVLALAQSRRATGAQLLASYIVGVEVACRLGDAVDPSHYLDGFHPTGTLGTFGAAAACSHLLKLKPISIRHALGIAGTMAAGVRANRGTMAKGLNAGRAAESGVIAATLAADGFSASENIFDDPMGFFAAACKNKFDKNLITFGKPYCFASPGVGIKLYPCAGVLHPALDIVLELRQLYAIAAEQVERIKVILDHDAALPLVYDRPKDALQAKFSVPFAVAVALVDGAAGLKQFSAERVRDPKIRNQLKRVELIGRPTRKRTSHIGIDTEVEIAMKDGTVHRGHADIARGHPALPTSRAEIDEKFRNCAEGLLTPKQLDKFLRHFDTLERAVSVTHWLSPLNPLRR